MSIEFFNPPEIDEIIARCKTYIKGELGELNPTDQNSLIYSLIVALANLSNDNNKQILIDILPNIFPQYCKSEESLINHAEIKNVTRNPATPSKGKATIQGEIGNTIPMGTILIANDKEYKTENSVEIDEYSIGLFNISINGTIATVTTVSSHNFASNINVTISGAEDNRLNGEFPITVTGINQFTYQVSESITTEEDGENLLGTANIAVLNINSTTTGSDTNLSNGDTLALSEQIEGVNSNAYTEFSGISGGANLQSFESWKNVVIDRYKNPITYFNENNIKQTLLNISGITKVWVYPITPSVGQVTVYFIRGNDENIIPDIQEILQATEKILELRTVKDDPNDVFVYPPTPKVIDFTFSEIVPDTPTMKVAIQNSLQQLFENNADLGVNLTALEYNNAIGNSYDMETGTKLRSYVLDSPTGDQTVSFGELPVLGSVTFL